MQYVLLVYGIGSFRTFQAPIRLHHALFAVYDAQQLRTLHRTHVGLYRYLSAAQGHSFAYMGYLLHCPYCNLCGFCGVMGGVAPNTFCEMVCVWNKRPPQSFGQLPLYGERGKVMELSNNRDK